MPPKRKKEEGGTLPPPPTGNNGQGQEERKKQRRDEGSPSTKDGSPPTFQWDEGKLHPLLIPHVIENILSNLCGEKVEKNIQVFRNCRLVNSEWNEAANRLYKRSGKEVMFGAKRCYLGFQYGSSGTMAVAERMKKFMKDSEQSFDNPFTIFRFTEEFLTEIKHASIFKDFLASQFQWITILHLQIPNSAKVNLKKKDLKNANLQLETLEDLTFHIVRSGMGRDSWDGRQKMQLTYLLEAMLEAAVNLKKFSFSHCPALSKAQISIAYRFGVVITEKCPKTVKTLNLRMILTDGQLQALTKLGLSLVSFVYDRRQSEVKPNTLQDLLYQQKDSLEELELTNTPIETDYRDRHQLSNFEKLAKVKLSNADLEVSFPRFEKMKCLKIQANSKANSEFSYSKNFPVLQSLELLGKWTISSTWMGLGPSSSSTIRKLQLFLTNRDKSLISLARKYFPNITALHIIINRDEKEILPCVFTSLKDLEELEITCMFSFPTNLDPTLTGLTGEECKELRLSGSHYSDVIGDPTFVRTPSIADMTNLRRLTIRGRGVRLTKVTAILGFLKLANLKYLETRNFHFPEAILTPLKERMKIVQIDKHNKSEESRNYYATDSESDSGSSVSSIESSDDGEDEDEWSDESMGWGDRGPYFYFDEDEQEEEFRSDSDMGSDEHEADWLVDDLW